jgi:DNA repair protein RecO (recombination protein O)
MPQKTKGIALHYYKYSESSIIAKIFTKNFGLQSVIINGVRQRNAKSKLGLLQPFTLLDLWFMRKPKSGLKRLKEIANSKPLIRITTDINRRLLAVFFSEVLLKVLIEDEKEELLFNFTEKTVFELDEKESLLATYPLNFLLTLTSFLGFYPSKEYSDLPFFDLLNGHFSKNGVKHSHFIAGTDLHNFKSLLLGSKTDLSYRDRKGLLLILLDYFKLHHHELKNLKSHTVIEQLHT